MKRLSEEKQKRIMQRIAEGLSSRQIAIELGVSKSAVHDELLRHLGPKTFDELVPSPAKPGRPRKLPEQIARIVIRSIVSGESKTAEAAAGMISSTHGICVTGATVRNTLKRHRVRAIEKPSKPRLSVKNVKDRMQWAKDHQHWTIDDWKRVVWSNETKICRFSSDGCSWAWIREDCHMELHHVKQTVKHGGGSIMIWGCMTYNGGGFMCKVEGRMNGELYRSILQDELQQTIEHYELDPETVVFQHDNDLKHTCKMVKTFLAEQLYSVLPWPASSPDLNPIEHLWVYLKKQLLAYPRPPAGILELWDRVQVEWEKIPAAWCSELIDSMPRCVRAVLKAKGRWTKSLPPLPPSPAPPSPAPPSPAPPCLPCVKGRQRAAPHSSSFPPTTAPVQTLHMDRFGQDLPVLRLHYDCGGEFYSDLLRDFCRGEGILQSSLVPPLSAGDASVFRVWGSCAFVRDTSADKLSARAIPCVFLGFVLDAPNWQFYHPTSRRVLPSQDVTFDESVPFYRLFPYRSAPPPFPPLFLAPSPPLVDPLPPQGPAPSGVSQVEPLLGPTPVQVAVSSGAARGAAFGGAVSGGAEPGGVESEGAGSGGAEPGGEEPRGAEPEGVEPGGAESEGAESMGAEPRGAASSGAPGARGVGDAGAGGAGVTGGAGGTGGTAAAGPGAGDPMESRAAGARGSDAGGARVGGARVGGTGAGGVGAAGDGAPASPLPAPSPYSEQIGNLTKHRELASCPVSPVRTARRIARSRPPPFRGTNAMALRPSFEYAAASTLVAELLDFAAACRLDYATALVVASASTSPPSIEVDGMWIFRVKWPPTSSPAFKARYIARGFSQRHGVEYFQTFSPTSKITTLWVLLDVAAQRDYELHSQDLSTAFLQGSLHEEIWLRRPPGFTGSFPAGTQWSLRRPIYGLRQASHEWHDTLRTTLAALGFAPSTADPSLFLRTDTSLPPLYVLVYVDDLVFATTDNEALTLVKSELQKRHTCTDLGELRSYLGLQITRDKARRTITLTRSHMVHQVHQRFGFQLSSPQPTPLSTGHSLSAPPSDESVEPSGPYPKLVGCLITSGMGLVLGGRGPIVLTGHADSSWADDSAMQRSSQGYTFSLGSGSVSWRSIRSSSVLSSSCEAEIYAGAMAAQELRWLTYLMTDLGEQPRVPPVLFIDNKAMIALCQEHRLEHTMKHIALRYILARELQQRGQLHLAYVATRANTADVFTKALPLGDHQHISTVFALCLLCLTYCLTLLVL
ncbi:unnamed protein product [Closterium sp. NIES-54]